jgi:hypothetical protein
VLRGRCSRTLLSAGDEHQIRKIRRREQFSPRKPRRQALKRFKAALNESKCHNLKNRPSSNRIRSRIRLVFRREMQKPGLATSLPIDDLSAGKTYALNMEKGKNSSLYKGALKCVGRGFAGVQ